MNMKQNIFNALIGSLEMMIPYKEGSIIPPSIAKTEYADKFTVSKAFTLAIVYNIFTIEYAAAINRENIEKSSLNLLIANKTQNPTIEV